MAKNTNITPKNNVVPAISRLQLGNQAMPSLNTVSGRIYENDRKELRFPDNIKLYKAMELDCNISAAMNIIEIMVGKSGWKISVPENAPDEEKQRQVQLSKDLSELERPWEDYVTEWLTMLVFGFCPVEKIFKRKEGLGGKFGSSEYAAWDDFPVISQATVDKWIFAKDTGKLLGLRQTTARINNDLVKDINFKAERDIPKKKFLLFRNRTRGNNPEGKSSLDSCYQTWKLKILIEEYETIGVSKDLGGITEIGIAAEILAAANTDPAGEEAALVNKMIEQGEATHAGEKTCIVLPISYDQNNNPLYTFKLKGIEGDGKQYDTSSIVARHDKRIQATFLTDVLSLGQDGSGSFALSDNKLSLLNLAIERILKNIKRTLNHDLMRQTYELNGWEYNKDTACHFDFEEFDDDNLEEFAKAVQQVLAAGAVRITEDIETVTRKKVFGLPAYKDAETEEIETHITTKSGEGMEEGLNNGTGSSTSKGGDRTAGNTQNK